MHESLWSYHIRYLIIEFCIIIQVRNVIYNINNLNPDIISHTIHNATQRNATPLNTVYLYLCYVAENRIESVWSWVKTNE